MKLSKSISRLLKTIKISGVVYFIIGIWSAAWSIYGLYHSIDWIIDLILHQ